MVCRSCVSVLKSCKWVLNKVLGFHVLFSQCMIQHQHRKHVKYRYFYLKHGGVVS